MRAMRPSILSAGLVVSESAEEVVRLLQRPFPRGHELELRLSLCATWPAPLVEMPPADSQMEDAISALAGHGVCKKTDCKPCRRINVLESSGIDNVRGQAEGTLPIKTIDNTFAEVIEVDAIPAPNRALSVVAEKLMHNAALEIGRIAKGESRREILVIPIPVRLAAIGFFPHWRSAGRVARSGASAKPMA